MFAARSKPQFSTTDVFPLIDAIMDFDDSAAEVVRLSRREVVARMASIAAFAEIESFLDAPVRTYSTGMSARLAFAVATDVDPDVLLVDEALAVGDERFKARCHERMKHFRERERTFLLVSHNLPEVVETCQRAVWIADGRVMRDGPAADVCREYREWSRNGGAAERNP